jgi:hypothetical protein
MFSLGAYSKEFEPRDFGDVYRAGGTPGVDTPAAMPAQAPAPENSQSSAPAAPQTETP